jgi:signal transduction histidine kinase
MHQIASSLTLRFEERIGERTRIARELHDTLLQSFQGSLFEFQAAQKLMSNRPEEARPALDRAIDSAKAAIAEGRDAIQGLRLGSGDPEGLADLLRGLGKQCLNAQTPSEDNTSFHVTLEGPPEPLVPVLQDELFRIGQEILRNAFRHAHAKQIEVEIRYSARELRLRIRDDGTGIDSKVLNAGARPGHWGLPGVRERAKLIGAEFDLWSQAAAGTEIQIRVPASLAYLKSRSFDRLRLLRIGTGLYGD